MKVYSYSQARQQLASLLNEAVREGSVRIRRRDGGLFEIAPVSATKSALDVPSLTTDIGADEIVSVVRESRRRAATTGRQRKRLGSVRRAGRARTTSARSRASRRRSAGTR